MATVIEKVETAWKGWLTLHEVHLRDDRGDTFARVVEHHGSGVAVLPYDPERRVALVIRLARAPVLLSGELDLLIEVPAGLVDEGEEPAAAARREAFEEAGVEIATLEPLGLMWTMPGISTERMSLYLGSYRRSDVTSEGGGLREEHENITVQEVPLATLAALADSNRLTDMRTLITVLRLRHMHPDLF